MPVSAGFGWIDFSRLRAVTEGCVPGSDDAIARNEGFWTALQEAFSREPRAVAPSVGAPRDILEAFVRDAEFTNQMAPPQSALLAEAERARRRLTIDLRCGIDELVLTRGTTEALNIVAAGLQLSVGDEILATDAEYPTILDAFRQRAARDGVVLTLVPLPYPGSDEEIIAAFERAMTQKTRALLCSHVTYGAGRIMPIAALRRLAHRAGAQIIVDGALGFGHVHCDLTAMACDYYAASLHKYLGAPLGTGFLFVRRDRVAPLSPLYGAPDPWSSDIRKFACVGSQSPAPFAAVTAALDFREVVGAGRIEARLRYLTSLWTGPLRRVAGASVLTADDCTGGIAHVALTGVDADALAASLRRELGVAVFGGFRDRPALCGLVVFTSMFTPPAALHELSDRIAAAVSPLGV